MNIMKLIRNKKILFLLPFLCFFKVLYDIFFLKIHISNDLEWFHVFLLLELIALVVFYIRFFFNICKNFMDICLVGSLLLGMKIFMLYISDISIDSIYLLKILFSIFIEVIPLLILKPFISKNKFLNLFYVLLAALILILNISITLYYYNTFTLIEPIIFTNFNSTSINGFFTNNKLLFFIFSILFIIILYLFYYLSKFKFVYKKLINYYLKLLITAFVLFTSYKLLFVLDKITVSKIVALYGNERKTKDKIVEKITSNSFVVFFKAYEGFIHPAYTLDRKHLKKIQFSKSEILRLKNMGLFFDKTKIKGNYKKTYTRIILLPFESLSIDFIHFYNNKIPHQASYYFDYLLSNYFHLNNYWASNMPTDYGWTAMMRSKLDLKYEGGQYSLVSYLRRVGYLHYHIMAVSKFYGIMWNYYSKAFSFNPKYWFYRENLEKEYGKTAASGWGIHNNFIFKKAIEVLKENRNKKIFLTLNPIDFHQPGPYCGISKDKLPNSIKKYNSTLINSVYWINFTLERFINNLKQENLFDDKTIIILTADHNPHPGYEYKEFAIKGNFRRLARIPLIIITKNKDFNSYLKSKENELYEQINLAPTLLSMLNIQFDKNNYFGSSIFSNNKFAYLGKYGGTLFYNYKNKEFQCKLDKVYKKGNKCYLIKKYYYYFQEK